MQAKPYLPETSGNKSVRNTARLRKVSSPTFTEGSASSATNQQAPTIDLGCPEAVAIVARKDTVKQV